MSKLDIKPLWPVVIIKIGVVDIGALLNIGFCLYNLSIFIIQLEVVDEGLYKRICIGLETVPPSEGISLRLKAKPQIFKPCQDQVNKDWIPVMREDLKTYLWQNSMHAQIDIDCNSSCPNPVCQCCFKCF